MKHLKRKTLVDKNGMVVNIIKAEDNYKAEHFTIIGDDGTAHIGDKFVNGKFIKKEEKPLPEDEIIQIELRASDKSMARVTEDIINLLISKKLIEISDIPPPVQSILNMRKELRGRLKNA